MVHLFVEVKRGSRNYRQKHQSNQKHSEKTAADLIADMQKNHERTVHADLLSTIPDVGHRNGD